MGSTRTRPGGGHRDAEADGTGELVALLRASREAAAPGARAAALDQLVARLYPLLGRCLRARLAGVAPDLLADLVQEGAARIAARAETCTALTDREVRAWACVVAVRAGVHFLRSPAAGLAERRGGVDPDTAPAAVIAAALAADAEPDLATAHHALCRLAVDAQAVLRDDATLLLWHKVLCDASWAEAAAALGTTAAGAKRRFQRAQATLRRTLCDRAAALPEPERAAVLDRLRRLEPTGLGPPVD